MIFTKKADFLNRVVNDPSVRPWAGTDGESILDLGPLLSIDGNFALVNDFGGFVFVSEGGGQYEFHTQFLPEGRGRVALKAAREAAGLMFSVYEAALLRTYVPHGNKAALGLVRLVGFSKTSEDDSASYWQMTRDDWQAREQRKTGKIGELVA